MINAIAESGTPLSEQKIVFFGAGSAAVGIAELVSLDNLSILRQAMVDSLWRTFLTNFSDTSLV